MIDSPQAQALRETLRAIEARLLQPAVRAEPDAVREHLAEGFVEFGASGQVFDRAAIVAALLAEPHRTTGAELQAFRLRAWEGDLAVTSCRVQRADGRMTLRSSTWRRGADGQWRMAFHQGTFVPEVDPGTS